MRIEAAAELFFTYLEHERGCSAATSTAYGSDVGALLRYLAQEGVEGCVESLTAQVLRRYVSWLSISGYSAGTIARRVYAISSLFRYLVSYGYAEGNPCQCVVVPKRRRRMPSVLSLEEARGALVASEDHRWARMGFRNRAIVAVLLFCGLRRAEVAGLATSDVDLRSGWLKVRNGKGGRPRSVPLVREVGDALRDWLEFRPAVDHDCLFTGLGGKALGCKGVANVFKRSAKGAGVWRAGVSAHTARHTFASLLLQEGCDLVSIQQLLGHADLSSTSIYLHLEAGHLKSAVERHPLCGGIGL